MKQTSTIEGTYKPQSKDILCGRSKEAFHHAGNIGFRQSIAIYLPLYLAVETRKRRQVLIASILDEILTDGGCFLEQKEKCGWVPLTRAQSHRKVGHALRDAALRESARISKCSQIDNVSAPRTRRMKKKKSVSTVSQPSGSQPSSSIEIFSDEMLESLDLACLQEGGNHDSFQASDLPKRGPWPELPSSLDWWKAAGTPPKDFADDDMNFPNWNRAGGLHNMALLEEFWAL